MSSEPTNGDLPAAREAIIEQAQRVHQEVSHQRDMLIKREGELMVEVAGLKAQLSVAELSASQMQSKADSAMSVRDEAVARRAEVETVLKSVMALLRTFQIDNVPLIKEVADEIIPPPARTSPATGKH